MPRRTVSSLSKNTAGAKRKRLAIDNESSQERQIRLSQAVSHMQSVRASQSPSQRNDTQSLDRSRQLVHRSYETNMQTESRLSLDRERHAVQRLGESSAETQSRRTSDIERHVSQRQRETSIQREVRRQTDREQHALHLQNETAPRRSTRLERDRLAHIESRAESLINSVRNITNRTTSDEQVRNRWMNKELSGLRYDRNIEYRQDGSVSLGQMEIVCRFCNAKKFKDESPGLCCQQGKVKLEHILPPPEPLFSLLSGQHPQHKEFQKNIRSYNNAFQMTSFGAKQIIEPGYMPTFKIQGQAYHLAGSVLPLQSEHKFLQLYFISDYESQATARCNNAPLNRNLILSLQDMLHTHNSYVLSFKSALETLPPNPTEFKIIIHASKKLSDGHRGQFNAPTTDEVAILIEGQEFCPRDIILHGRNNTVQRVSELNRAYDALQYPLMLCRGEDGYSITVMQTNPAAGGQLSKTVSSMNYYAYRMMIRTNDFNMILRFGMLTNQFWVDQYAKIESERLNFIRNNQRKLRADSYIHLQDALRADENVRDVGQLVVLPSSFTAGPRYMHERTQDAMVYVRNYGTPDLFITFTCNPNWPEIKENLLPNNTPQGRYDLINRVFHLKMQYLMNLINKGNFFGAVRCFIYTVEWQKRGLPHVHLLVWLQTKIRPNEIDDVISAEIPDPNSDPELYASVTKHLIHGPCGSLNRNCPCMNDGKCSKKYPKKFVDETSTGENGYPTYRRRHPDNGGHTVTLNNRSGVIEIDNQWVVPYNPVLIRVFDAHINVEFCHSVKSIKYVCKYIMKGSDQAVFSLNSHNEVEQFQSGRYISSSEAVWRILSFSIHERSPAVIHLAVHLENGQRVYFTEQNAADIAANPSDTTLTGFFKLCQGDHFAKTLLYHEIPTYFTWNQKIFTRRKQGSPVEGYPGVRKSNALGRVYTVHPNNSECYYLRMLLHVVRGPTSFESLKMVDEVQHDTYQSACMARGLLQDDSHWNDTLTEAGLCTSSASMRSLFCVLLTFCHVSDPLALWNAHKESLAEDILHRLRANNSQVTFNDQVFDLALIEIEKQVQTSSGKSIKSMGLPIPDNIVDSTVNNDYIRETSYNRSELHTTATRNELLLNSDQKNVYDQVIDSVRFQSGTIFFLDAPGGTGKTFLINLLLAKLRSEGQIALAVASSGIAATLLDGGRTAHSLFKLPLNMATNDNPVCNILKQSAISKLMQECTLIVWDESSMAHKKSIEALDRTLKDLRNNTEMMGGVTFLAAGDFRQTLPVIQRGTRADEVEACLKRSYLWTEIEKLSLSINMRAQLFGDNNMNQFSGILLQLGNGAVPETNREISIDNINLCTNINTLQDLIKQIYPDVQRITTKPLTWFQERAILTSKNEIVENINKTILNMIESPSRTYTSVDTVVEEEDAVHYPTEFLNSLNPSGLPVHVLAVKIGAPIMLLRNISPPKLCNGTRLQVNSLRDYVIEATIMSGTGTGEKVLIPRIPMIPTDLPFQFKRLQFPIRVCFAMTINKSQGQTLKVAGVDLRQPCFSHGQLYVACSRVSCSSNLYILAPNKKTRNVVYKEALI